MFRKEKEEQPQKKEVYPLLTEKGIEIIRKYTTPRTHLGMGRFASYKVYGEDFWRIGYGSKKLGKRVIKYNDKISQDEAVKQLIEDLKEFSKEVQPYILVRLNNNKKAAILSFAFDLGLSSFKNSKLLHLINIGASRKEIIREWSPFINRLWQSGGEMVVNRRRTELNTYLEPEEEISSYFPHSCHNKYCLLNLCETWNGSPYQIKAIEYLERKISSWDETNEVMRRFFRYWNTKPGGQQSPQQQ